MKKPVGQVSVEVPQDYPASLIYVDESGTAGNGRFFVVGALKVRKHGELMRSVRSVRDRYDFHKEFHFTTVTRAGLPMYLELVDLLADADVNLAATVVDRTHYDPGARSRDRWRIQADVTSRLLCGCINKRELVSVLLDQVSTPVGVAFEDEVRKQVNRRLKNMSVVTAACLNSSASDGLQLADILASAVAFDHRRRSGVSGKVNSHKARVVTRVLEAFGVSEMMGRSERVNVLLLGPPRGPAPVARQALSVVQAS